MKRALLILLALSGVAALSVTSLPGFNLSLDKGKVITIGARGFTYDYPLGVVSVTDWGADPTGVADSLDAFYKAIGYATGNYCASGGSCLHHVLTCTTNGDCSTGECQSGLCISQVKPVHIPIGTYYLSDELELQVPVELYGDGVRMTRLKPKAGENGIIIRAHQSGTSGKGRSDSTHLHDFNLEPAGFAAAWQANHRYAVGDIVTPTVNPNNGLVFHAYAVSGATGGTSGGAQPTWPTAVSGTVGNSGVTWIARFAAGIQMEANATVEDVYVISFDGHGLQVIADVTATPPTNANGWTARRMYIATNKGDGVHTDGGDSNRGSFSDSTVSDNDGFGINEDSFLGNVYRNIITQANTDGGYVSLGANSRSMFLDCYSEADETASRIKSPAMVIGGLFANGFTTDSTGARLHQGQLGGSIEQHNGNGTDGYTRLDLGGNDDDEQILAWQAENSSQSVLSGTDFKFKYWRSQGLYRFDIANSNTDISALIASGQADAAFKKGQWSFPIGIGIGGPEVSIVDYPLFRSGPPPVAGAFKAGDIYWNESSSNPTLLGYKNIASGSPGTFQAFFANWATTTNKRSVSSATALTTATAKTITSLSVPSTGTWEVTGAIGFTGSPTGTILRGGWSTVNDSIATVTAGTYPTLGVETPTMPTAAANVRMAMPRAEIGMSAGTIYLVGEATFSGGAVSAYGEMYLRKLSE